MNVTLKKQMCGHVVGAVVGVSEDRAYLWMVKGIAEPDRSFLEARKRDTDRLLAKTETEKKKRGRPTKK